MQKRTRPIYSHLYQTSLVNKEFIIWPKKELISCATKAENPRAALPARVANQNTGFASFCELADLAIL